MGVMGFKTKLSDLKSDQYLRCDTDYLEFNKTVGTAKRYLKNFVPIFETGKPITKQDYSENGDSTEYIHLVVRNIKNGVLNLDDPIYINEEKGEALKQFKIESGDIVVAISANCGSAFYFEQVVEDCQLTLSHYLSKFKVNPEKLNPRLLVYYLNSKTIQKYFRATETGKTQKNLSKTYLRELPIFLPSDLNSQNEILHFIVPIEAEISELKQQVINPVNIINQVFGEAFGFNWTEFESVKQEKTYSSSIIGFANNIDCRMGIRFHNKAGQYVQAFLEQITKKRIKDFISESIVLGKSVSPKDYDEDGEYFYIAMSNIKTWAFDPEDCKKVSDDYSSSNLNKTVQKGDILLARSGEGTIGKVALIEDEEINGIFADFTQRIRLTGFDPLCAYYYFRSDFFQYLVYTHKKGLGNNTNIFPSQIKEFPMPDWNETKQAEIVEAIKSQLDEQEEIDRLIEEKQKAINTIIEDAISLNQKS
jgi:type I restriction enzyme, S subunit